MHGSNIALVAVSLSLALAPSTPRAAPPERQLAQLQWDSSTAQGSADVQRRAAERHRRERQKALDEQRRAQRDGQRRPADKNSGWRADDSIATERIGGERMMGGSSVAPRGRNSSSGGSRSGTAQAGGANSGAERFRPAIEVMRHAFMADTERENLARGLTDAQRGWEARTAARVDEAASVFGGQPATRWGRRVAEDERFSIFQRRNGTLIADRQDRRMAWRAISIDSVSLANGWTETVATRDDGTTVSTLHDDQDVAIRRTRRDPDGQVVTLFNNLPRWWGGEGDIAVSLGGADLDDDLGNRALDAALASAPAIFDALTATPDRALGRSFTLNQILMNRGLRDLMPSVDVNSIHFDTGSADIDDSELETLETIGAAIAVAVEQNPREIYLVEGHTDAQGDPFANLRLSARRADAVAQALTEAFEIPPENLVIQGYGEFNLKHETVGSDRRNRRVSVRRLTPLMTEDAQLAAIEGLAGVE